MKSIASGRVLRDADIRLPGRTGGRCVEAPAAADTPLSHNQVPPPRPKTAPRSAQRLAQGLPEAVFQPDSRKRLHAPNRYPYSAICSLEIFNNKGELYYGTGFLVGPRLVLTAGHNVFFHGENFMKSINVYPGLNGDRSSPPFRAASAEQFFTVEAWVQQADRQFDFGAIVLPTDLGNDAGWLSVSRFSENTLKGLTVNLAGFPKDQPDGSTSDASIMWRHNGKLTVESNRLKHMIDTSVGQSGSPLFAVFEDKQDPYHVVGIHNTAFDTYNAATRINDSVFSQILEWRRESDA